MQQFVNTIGEGLSFHILLHSCVGNLALTCDSLSVTELEEKLMQVRACDSHVAEEQCGQSVQEYIGTINEKLQSQMDPHSCAKKEAPECHMLSFVVLEKGIEQLKARGRS